MTEHIQRLMAATDAEQLIDQVLCARKLRSSAFGTELFADPAWDIVLNLFLASIRRRTMTLDELAEAMDLSLAVTSRWLNALLSENLVQWNFNGCDGQLAAAELTAKGHSAMRRWLSQWLNCPCEPAVDSNVQALLDRMLRTDR